MNQSYLEFPMKAGTRAGAGHTRMARRWAAARARRRSPAPGDVQMPRARRCSATRLMACSQGSE